MKLAKCLLLLLFFVGCKPQLTPEQKKSIRTTRTKISCFTPEGWVDYYTAEGEAFWRGGWSFYNLEGEKIQSSMCHRVFKPKAKEI